MTFPKQVTKWLARDKTLHDSKGEAMARELSCLGTIGETSQSLHVTQIVARRHMVIEILSGKTLQAFVPDLTYTFPCFDWSKLPEDWGYEPFITAPHRGRIKHVATGCEYFPHQGGFYVPGEDFRDPDKAHAIYMQGREAANACRIEKPPPEPPID